MLLCILKLHRWPRSREILMLAPCSILVLQQTLHSQSCECSHYQSRCAAWVRQWSQPFAWFGELRLLKERAAKFLVELLPHPSLFFHTANHPRHLLSASPTYRLVVFCIGVLVRTFHRNYSIALFPGVLASCSM